ncbi:MAG: hypothetical protein QM749_12550 [Aquabacterium sp.]
MKRAIACIFPILLSACATTSPNVPASGYLCCNMRTDGSWISDSNYAESGKYIIPAGTPVKYLGSGRYRVYIEVEGKKQAIGNDYSRDLSMDAFANRYIVTKDPRPQIALLPPHIRTAIETARVTKGMTRDQVLVAIGYPISNETPHLDSTFWKYWLWSFSPILIKFNESNTVTQVETDSETLQNIFLE